MKYEVTYSAWGQTTSMIFEDPQEDGIPARQKALDYYNTAVCSKPDVGAWCTISKDGYVVFDTRWG